MSQAEALLGVANKFNQITEILTETNIVKKIQSVYEANDENVPNDVLIATKTIVDKLFDQVDNVKEIFYQIYNELSQEKCVNKNKCSDNDSDTSPQEDLESTDVIEASLNEVEPSINENIEKDNITQDNSVIFVQEGDLDKSKGSLESTEANIEKQLEDTHSSNSQPTKDSTNIIQSEDSETAKNTDTNSLEEPLQSTQDTELKSTETDEQVQPQDTDVCKENENVTIQDSSVDKSDVNMQDDSLQSSQHNYEESETANTDGPQNTGTGTTKESTDETTKTAAPEEDTKKYISLVPLIKLVDINKLLIPSTTELPSPKVKKSVTFDSTVIVLTDSEEGSPKKSQKLSDCESDRSETYKRSRGGLRTRESLRSENTEATKETSEKLESSDDDCVSKPKKKNSQRKSAGKKSTSNSNSKPALDSSDEESKKNRVNLDSNSSEKYDATEVSSNSDVEMITDTVEQPPTTEKGTNELDKNESDAEVNNKKVSHSSSVKAKTSGIKKHSISKKSLINEFDSSDSDSSDSDNPKSNVRRKATKEKKSVHPNGQLYIPLPRISCCKLQEIYEKNKEIQEIKRLTNMKSLKTKRSRAQKNSSSPKSSDSDGPTLKKQKKTPASNSADLSENDEHSSFEDIVKDNDKNDEINTSKDNEVIEAETEEPVATGSADFLSDADSNENSDTEAKNKKKKKQDKESKKDDKKEKKKDSEDEVSDSDKKSKKKWRNDKLLVGKLSSSDSEDNYQKYLDKKNKDTSSKKQRKRVNIVTDSDSDNEKKSSGDEFQAKSDSSSSEESKKSEEEEEKEKPKPKRKRIKRTKGSSSDEEEDKSTRKQIRKVMGKDSLSDKTKKAEADEKERKARIAEKQKKYNMIFESKDHNAIVEKVVLDFDEKTNEEMLTVDSKLVKKLKPHQASGIKFMWDACFESINRAQTTKGSGCILAHCMGLGKTLQVITLSHTLLVNSEQTNVHKVMVVCPVNTVLNWKSEYKKWLTKDVEFEVYELVSCKQNYERMYKVTDWHKNGGVLIIGYNMFRMLSNPSNKRLSKKLRTAFQEGLVDPGPDLVVCDEGHLLKNEKTNLSISMNRIKTQRRIVLTGTPLQNNLREYWCMVQFVKPNLLGTYKEYLNRFVNPITNGQYTDSTQHDIQVMRRRAHVLHKMLDGIVQRRDYAVLEPYLPPKHEYVLFVTLTETQVKMYQHYMTHFGQKSNGSGRTSFLFNDFQQLQRICTHPRVLLDKSIEDKEKKEKNFLDDEESEGSLKDFIDDGSDKDSSSSDSEAGSSGSKSGKSGDEAPLRKRTTRLQRAQRRDNNEPESDEEIESEAKKEWWQEYCDGDQLEDLNNSGKMFLLFEILKECEQIGDKILIFSQSLYTLNCIEFFLNKIDEATQSGNTEAVGGHTGSWSLGLDYFRLDGSSSCDNRANWCDQFNSPSNTRARLFLISTKAGGLGINLTAANRVIIFDVSWNPSHDTQSIYRVYRFGQTKPCYVYRFVTYGTMEMKIYERQVTKQAISKRVIDEQQIDRHYNQNDLQELYQMDLTPTERPTPLVPKDVLLGEMLQTYSSHIYKYHEHQSLLENKEEETLNEEERKAAWEEFENEKVNKMKNFVNQQAQGFSRDAVVMALSNIVRRDNPTWSDTQVNAIVPALMQQLQVQMQAGDITMYQRVQREINLIKMQEAQKLREQYYRQQMMFRMIRSQQQQQNMMGNMNIDTNQLFNILRQGATNTSSNEVIELN
ncbi:transcriptional regulator ATRX homolog isoform X2 [Aethina tumida]|uniref:transcriptional regulator ATRX homolog isoform X2 n=1 Tax=Aethina tumida TaxID=116153 RepID=UPI0021474B7B|nr:transcriptional regulator ATRX homolog isoform X2 [Aethina tumida]